MIRNYFKYLRIISSIILILSFLLLQAYEINLYAATISNDSQLTATDLYVATNGNDSNDGTKTSPFLTLAKAQAKVRDLLPNATGPINVWVRGGTYYLSNIMTFGSSDSATSTTPVTYSNYNDEKVVLSGGFKVTSSWSNYNGNIMKTNIGANKSVDLLYLNGSQQIMARYPNFNSSMVYLDGYASDAISTSRASRWANPSTGYIRALHNSMWGGNDYKITGKDSNNNIQYTWVGDNNRGDGMNGTYRMVENIFEELDAPGEWFYNKNTGDLYFYPPSGTNLSSSTVELSSLEELIKIVGNSSSKVKYLTFSGFNFSNVKRTLFSRTYEGLLRGDWSVVRAGTVYIQDSENITIKNCKFDQVGGNGVFISGYNKNHLIDNNDFIDNGSTCVQVVGLMSSCRYPSTWSNNHTDIVDTTIGALNSDHPQNITVSNNYMYNMGRFEKQSAGVNVSMSENVTVSHNTIHRSPRSGININDGTFGGHIIEYNDVFDCVRESGDHGPFNSWGRDRFWSYLGYDTNGNNGAAKYPYRELDAYKTTIIRNNRFHYSSVHEWGIDLDDGSSNYQIYNNLCLNTGFKLREGFDRHVYNNIIVNERANIHCTFEDAYNNVEKNIIINDTPISFANSSTSREITGHSHFDYNVFWNKGGSINLPSNWKSSGFDTHSIVADPKFKNQANLDYTVTNDSVLQQTGFKNFPMDQFGKAGCPTPPPISNEGSSTSPVITVTPVSTITPTLTTTPDTYVRIKNAATGLYIDGMGSTSNGSDACQWSDSGSNNQQWKIIKSGDYVMIQNRATSLYLDGMGRTSNGSICGQWDNSNSTNQQWIQETIGNNVRFKNHATGLYLDGMGSTSNGSNLCQWGDAGSTNQQWQIQ